MQGGVIVHAIAARPIVGYSGLSRSVYDAKVESARSLFFFFLFLEQVREAAVRLLR